MSTVASNSEPVHVGNVPLPTAEQLPDDIKLLKSMVRELLASLHHSEQDKQELRDRIDLLLRRLYGPRSERLNPDQLLLFEEPNEAQPPVAAPPPITPEPAP